MTSQKFTSLAVSKDNKASAAVSTLSTSLSSSFRSSPFLMQYKGLSSSPITTDFTLNDLQSLDQDHQFLSHLLPYDPSVKTGERLKDGLNEYLLLLNLTEQAMHALQKGDLHLFDPLVGENACQIRAVKIALIISDSQVNIERILDDIQLSKTRITEFLGNTSNFSNIEISLSQFLEHEKIDIAISGDDRFLIKSFILTRTKVVQPFFKVGKPLVENAFTDSKKIKEIGQVGSSFSCELVKNLRKKLSASSVDFIQELARDSNPAESSTKLLSDQFLTVHNGLKCLPYYWATRALMNHAESNNIPIALLAQQVAKDQDYKVIENTEIFFQSTPHGYKEICRSLLDPETPVLVLIGSTCRNLSELPTIEDWTSELLEQSPVDLVLAYAAAHRQYPDESQDQLPQTMSDKDYEYHLTKSLEWGCSLENPSRFFLTHAFCNKIKNIGANV